MILTARGQHCVGPLPPEYAPPENQLVADRSVPRPRPMGKRLRQRRSGQTITRSAAAGESDSAHPNPVVERPRLCRYGSDGVLSESNSCNNCNSSVLRGPIVSAFATAYECPVSYETILSDLLEPTAGLVCPECRRVVKPAEG